MINKKLILIVGILLVIGIIVWLIQLRQTTNIAKQSVTNGVQNEPKTHYHAGFVVFNEGQKVDFSDSKYMNIEPCKLNPSEKETPEEIQLDKGHLHENIGDVVHVHTSGVKWGDLFTNIKYPLDYSRVGAFINGQQITDLKDYPIKSYDSLVIFVGNMDQSLLYQAVSVDHIKEVESNSVECGD